jgi:flagellar motor switch protein FliM
MTDEFTSSLSRTKIQQLLAAVGSAAATDTEQVEATEYDWHEPHYFNGEQIERLEELAKRSATTVAEKLAHFFRSDFNVTVGSIKQHFAGELGEQLQTEGQCNRYLTFGSDQEHPCGFACIPSQTALNWLSLLLGDSETEKEPANSLSQLEESLLLDVASAVVEAFCGCLHGHYDFGPAAAFATGTLPVELQGVEEFCRIILTIEKAESSSSSEVNYVIPCATLAPIVGKTLQDDNQLSKDDNSKAILQHLQEMPVLVFARLASIAVTFEEIASLKPCDILLLNKPIEEPAEIIIEGRTIFSGRPARSANQRAVVITESYFENAEGSNPVDAHLTV